ncbi:hypothetical protein, partial [Actinomadura luteofluorescens]
MDASRRSRSRVIRFASRSRPARSAAVPAAHSAELVYAATDRLIAGPLTTRNPGPRHLTLDTLSCAR